MKTKPSPNNPCPFLRAMAAYGYLKEKAEALTKVSHLLSNVGGPTRAEGKLSGSALYVIAMIGNGLNPLRLFKSISKGLDIEKLRDGPLDKHGVGSGIINADGTINTAELSRLNEFAVDVIDPDTGKSDRGLTSETIKKMMDANFARAEGRRRKIDRALMDGEWPVLLAVMGKGKGSSRYLSLAELGDLFIENTLPQRVLTRIEQNAK